jgi:hypothetical protein
MKQEQECCQEVSGGYLGTTCPKCNKPFRSVIQEPKQETLEEVAYKIFSTMPSEISTSTAKYKALELAKWQQEQAKEIEEKNLLEMLHKFGFDYTYNYKGEKTIYEWIPEWFEGYQRLEAVTQSKHIERQVGGDHYKHFTISKSTLQIIRNTHLVNTHN